jgi:hypothetical protein
MNESKRQRRTHATREAVTKGSTWLPDVGAKSKAASLLVLEDLAPDDTHASVRSPKRSHRIRIKTLLRFYTPAPEGYIPPVLAAPPIVPTPVPTPNAPMPLDIPPPLRLGEEPARIALNPEDIDAPTVTFRGRVCVVAADMGRALRYGDEGRDLADLVTKSWRECLRGHDYDVLTGDDLREFKAEVAKAEGGPSLGSTASAVVVLYESGWDIALFKANRPEGWALRHRIVTRALPAIRRAEAQPIAPALDPVAALIAALPKIVEAAVRGAMASLPAAAPPALPEAPPVQAPAPVALIPTDWKTADTIAAIVGDRLGTNVTAARVHKVIREHTDVRTNPMLARTRQSIRIDEATGARKENPQWFYAPAVIGMVHSLLAPAAGDDSASDHS